MTALDNTTGATAGTRAGAEPGSDAAGRDSSRRRREKVAAYVALTKPRIIELLLVTTVPVMFLAERGVPSLWLIVATLMGGALSAGAANTFNMIYDRDIDAKMHRTSNRPLVTGAVSVRGALVFAVILTAVSTLWFAVVVNVVSAALSLLAIALYAVGYTILLKRRTTQNIVWGGIAGCFPPLIGWTAVTGAVAWPPFILFAVVFLWTPPHTWALAFRYKDDYAAADVPMLPVVRTAPHVGAQIFWYSLATVVVSLLLWPVTPTGWLYPVVAAVAGAVFLWEAAQLWRRARAGMEGSQLKAMKLFHYSNTYLAILFLAVAIDPLLF